MVIPRNIRIFLIVALVLAGIIFLISNLSAPSKEPFEDVNPVGDFFLRMSKPDLHARGLRDMHFTSDYKDFYFSNISEPTPEQVSILRILCSQADGLIRDIGFTALLDIPWNFKMIPDDLENGYPHTLGNTIYIPKRLLDSINTEKSEEVVQTLIHERIHLFQRSRPNETEILVGLWGFVGSTYVDGLQRNNPDLNGINYIYQGSVILQKYNSPRPSSLMDSIVVAINKDVDFETPIKNATVLGFPYTVRQFEHPYEIMADLLAYIIVHQEALDDVIKQNSKVITFFDWMNSLKASSFIINEEAKVVSD